MQSHRRFVMKKILVLLLVLLVTTGMVFSQGAKEGEKKQLMGVVTPSADHGFTAESIQHCEAI